FRSAFLNGPFTGPFLFRKYNNYVVDHYCCCSVRPGGCGYRTAVTETQWQPFAEMAYSGICRGRYAGLSDQLGIQLVRASVSPSAGRCVSGGNRTEPGNLASLDIPYSHDQRLHRTG